MKSQTIKLYLDKHKHENRYMMCWYRINIDGKILRFRSDKFVPKKVEEKLHSLHCTESNVDTLTNKCVKVLNPYCTKIINSCLKFIKENPTKKEETGFVFDGPSIEWI